MIRFPVDHDERARQRAAELDAKQGAMRCGCHHLEVHDFGHREGCRHQVAPVRPHVSPRESRKCPAAIHMPGYRPGEFRCEQDPDHGGKHNRGCTWWGSPATTEGHEK